MCRGFGRQRQGDFLGSTVVFDGFEDEPKEAGLLQRRRPSPFHRRVGFRITLFEACSAFTHVTACTLARPPEATLYTGVLVSLRYLHDRSDCYRLERPLAGWESHPLKIRAFPRRTE